MADELLVSYIPASDCPFPDFPNCKIYFDGCNYVAIPYSTRFCKRRKVQHEDPVSVQTDTFNSELVSAMVEKTEPESARVEPEIYNIEQTVQSEDKTIKESEEQRVEQKMTRKEIFEKLFQEYLYRKKSEKREIIIEKMLPYFDSVDDTARYVNLQLDRKRRNAICRRVRLTRKVNLQQDFSYFCTFTYDSKKHTEESFQKTFRNCLKKLCYRKGWKYCGVWERSPEKQRLHFHGLFYIPEGTMPGELIEVNDFSPIKNKVQHTIQNTYFNERFGRSDFKVLESEYMLRESLAYLMKYMEKTGEKIVYSKNLPQYFYSDVEGKDIICDFGLEGKKKILFPNFTCWDYGEYMGQVSKETIARLRKCN